jgi:hypothetical protein
MDPKKQLSRLMSSTGGQKLYRIRSMILIGCTKGDLVSAFYLTVEEAELLIAEFRKESYVPEPICMGSKKEQYYKEEFPTTPVYLLEELEAEEKMISLKDTSCKLWTWIE